MNNGFIALVLLTILAVSCGPSEPKNAPEKGIGLDGEEVTMKDLPVQEFTALPAEITSKLKDQIQSMDLEIISNPGQKTIADPQEMATILSFISPEVAIMDRSCDIKALLSIELQDSSRYLLQVFAEEACGYVIFFEKTRALHANKLTPDGIQYFQDAMRQKENEN